MNQKKRVMFVGTGSGCGKTTITCGIMKAFCQAGEHIIPFKCGPDYIDPMFHRHITGVPSTNLDSFFLEKDALCWLMGRRISHSDLGIVEGVMGAFDGVGTSVHGSSFEIALWTKTPMILIVNGRGMSLSVAAQISGFVEFAGKFGGRELIQGVILNQVTKGTCEFLKPAIEEHTGVKVLGYFERQPRAVLESRHLGLVTAGEVEDLDERMNELSGAVASSIDLNAIRSIAASAQALPGREPAFMSAVRRFADEGAKVISGGGKTDFSATALASGAKCCSGGPAAPAERRPRLGVAMDRAFCFYYYENLELLKMLGVELVYFSPLKDALPPGLSGLYLGGGYPELFAGELSKNKALLEAIRESCQRGMPLIAECGGFMYLHEFIDGQPMAGVIPGKAYMTGKLSRPFGYITLESREPSVLGPENTVFLGHEFHYSVSECGGSSFKVSKNNGRTWEEGVASPTMYAGYPHLYFYSNVDAVIRFVQAMREYK